jgi:hypothetical protein
MDRKDILTVADFDPPVAPKRGAESKLSTVPQAATCLGVAPWAIRSAIWSRQLAFVKLGRAYLLDPRDFDKLAARRERTL